MSLAPSITASSRPWPGSVYGVLGVALHDLRNPQRSLAWAIRDLAARRIPGKSTGYVHNVVFTCGAVPESDGTGQNLLGPARTTVMCVGEANLSDLVALCLDHARPAK